MLVELDYRQNMGSLPTISCCLKPLLNLFVKHRSLGWLWCSFSLLLFNWGP